MKLLIGLMVWPVLLFSAPSVSAAADRDAADRSTRQESDELRADMRQHRLKKVKDLEGTSQQQEPDQKPKADTKPKPGS